jgi:hypothetical protein
MIRNLSCAPLFLHINAQNALQLGGMTEFSLEKVLWTVTKVTPQAEEI